MPRDRGLDKLPAETVSVADAAGRVLAERQGAPDAAAGRPVGDDGYAVRAEDVPAVPTTLTLVGQAPAGGSYDHALSPARPCASSPAGPCPWAPIRS